MKTNNLLVAGIKKLVALIFIAEISGLVKGVVVYVCVAKKGV